ncbi:solute carrier family 66 member 2-like [Aquarana catesbeiana]|uniref:solute carrier family 66 member 2-like n=1 Tax=Aquarana catesbeiana TaxID=8400 RepID=UPI003CCA317A
MMDADGDGGWLLLSWVSSCLMVVGGIIPYIPQYQEIKKTSNTEGFSTWVCLVLLVANILRIFFWFGKYFEFPLLLQSILMIGAMLAILNLCCSTQSANRVSTKQRSFTDFQQKDFWNWSRFEDYVQFCLVFVVCGALLTYVFIDVPIFVEGVGLLALMTEAMLGLPQFLQNRRNRSTRGMSVKMVLLWMAGDCFKTTYFIIKETPAQFWLCGALQIGLDIAILSQVYNYKRTTGTKFW